VVVTGARSTAAVSGARGSVLDRTFHAFATPWRVARPRSSSPFFATGAGTFNFGEDTASLHHERALLLIAGCRGCTCSSRRFNKYSFMPIVKLVGGVTPSRKLAGGADTKGMDDVLLETIRRTPWEGLVVVGPSQAW
jgi:hypothetical protein